MAAAISILGQIVNNDKTTYRVEDCLFPYINES